MQASVIDRLDRRARVEIAGHVEGGGIGFGGVGFDAVDFSQRFRQT